MPGPGGSGGEKRGLLKPGLQWKSASAPAPAGTGQPKKPAPDPRRPKGAPSNAVSQSQYTLDQLKKMAASRGVSVEKLVAQMVQQYLKEESGDK